MFTAAHIPEVDNVAADALSHNNDSFSPRFHSKPSRTFQLGTWVLGWVGSEPLVSTATMRSYQTGVTRFMSFCSFVNLYLFPLCESTYYNFVAFIVSQHLTLGDNQHIFECTALHQIAGGGHNPSLADMAWLHCVVMYLTGCTWKVSIFALLDHKGHTCQTLPGLGGTAKWVWSEPSLGSCCPWLFLDSCGQAPLSWPWHCKPARPSRLGQAILYTWVALVRGSAQWLAVLAYSSVTINCAY